MDEPRPIPNPEAPLPHHRRPRYSGKHPRRFAEKYKEHGGDAETVAKVLASGKTPAGTHRPIMVKEVLAALSPAPGEIVVDCTLGYGAHAAEFLKRIQPGGRLLGLDADPVELPKTQARLKEMGFGPETFVATRSNFAGLAKAMQSAGIKGADIIFADLGLSSMQIDDPLRGFSVKQEGPLDMRINPERGQPASVALQRISVEQLETVLAENSDESRAKQLAKVLAGKNLETTLRLRQAITAAISEINRDDQELTVRRVFQALRILINDEFGALEALLRQVPDCLKPGGRVGILSFHSGEDRRVKKAFAAGLASGSYEEISPEVLRASAEERFANPRSAPAKLRWARKPGDPPLSGT
jgi:16S rRNA (cytosine1402-N4)-methyltransferase